MIGRMSLVCVTKLLSWDKQLCINVNKLSQFNAVRQFFRLVSRLGDGAFWYTVMAGILIQLGDPALIPVLHMLIAGLTGTLIYKWIKKKTLRPRPYEVHQDISLTGYPLDRFSFPSGHTLHAVIFTLTGITYFPQLTMLLVPFTFLVGLSRVILGLHYPSDVLAGAGLGCLIGLVFILL
jgi:undecaprenyl-diphosphatase